MMYTDLGRFHEHWSFNILDDMSMYTHAIWSIYIYMCVLICRLVSPTWFLLEGEEAHPITIVLGISYLGLGSDLANQLATKVVELNDEYKAGEMLNQWDMKLGLNVGWCGKHSCGIGVMVDFMSSSMALTQEAVATSVFVRQAQVAKSTRHNVHYGM